MSNYNNTKATIAANVYTNHANQVTAEMVKTAINSVVDTIIAGGFLYKGVAIPSTNPGSPDANVAYIAATAGTYTNFGGLVVADGEVAVLKYNGSWSKEVTGAATAAEVAALGQEVSENTQDIEDIRQAVNNIQPIVIVGDVTNAPDEEDITTDENNLLKFADRTTLNGMGYKILRRNKTFAEQVMDVDTIYEIRYDFDLGGASVTIPDNCVLKFVGGQLQNGKLDGCINIAAERVRIFDNIELNGQLASAELCAEWFGVSAENADNSDIFDSIFDHNSDHYGGQIVLTFGPGIFVFKKTIHPSGATLRGSRELVSADYQYRLLKPEMNTVFQYLPDDYGTSIELDNSFETMENPQDYLDSEVESVFIEAGSNIGAVTAGLDSLVVENICFVAGDRVTSEAKNDPSYNTICCKFKTSYYFSGCLFKGWSKVFANMPTQYSRVYNCYAHGCQIFYYCGRGSNTATTLEFADLSVSNLDCFIKTIPASSYYTRYGLSEIILKNITLQGCEYGIVDWDSQITCINSYDWYYEANTNKANGHYLHEFLLSDYYAGQINAGNAYNLLPHYSEFGSFAVSNDNLIYSEYGNISISGGRFFCTNVIKMGANKLTITFNGFFSFISNRAEYYGTIVADYDTISPTYYRCFIVNGSIYRGRVQDATYNYMGRAAFGIPGREKLRIEASGDHYVQGVPGFDHLTFLDKSLMLGGPLNPEVAMNGSANLPSSYGIQAVRESEIMQERASTDEYGFGGVALRARRVGTTANYSRKAFLEADSMETSPQTRSKLTRKILQSCGGFYSEANINGFVNSVQASLPEFVGLQYFSWNKKKLMILAQNFVSECFTYPSGVSFIGTSKPTAAYLPVGFPFYNTSTGEFSILTTPGRNPIRFINFTFAEGVDKVSGTLSLVVGGVTLSMTLTDATLWDIYLAIASHPNNNNASWRFIISDDSKIHLCGMIAASGASPVLSFDANSITCPTGLSATVGTGQFGANHTWTTIVPAHGSNVGASLPATANDGDTYFRTSDHKLYTYYGGTWYDGDGNASV